MGCTASVGKLLSVKTCHVRRAAVSEAPEAAPVAATSPAQPRRLGLVKIIGVLLAAKLEDQRKSHSHSQDSCVSCVRALEGLISFWVSNFKVWERIRC